MMLAWTEELARDGESEGYRRYLGVEKNGQFLGVVEIVRRIMFSSPVPFSGGARC